jgi:hypothetical protein
MPNSPAWSHTSLTAFETCPKQYYHTKVAKDVAQDFGEAAAWGNKVHKLLEERLTLSTPLPDYLQHCEPIVKDILSRDGQLLVEEKVALDKDLRPVTFFAKDAWCRGVLDVGKVNERNAVILDWKTGKRKPDNDQLKLFAAFTFAKFPWVEKIATAFVWLKDNKLDKKVFTRKQDLAGIWSEVMPRVNRLDAAYQKDSWPAKPNGLCKAWCPVKSCEHNGTR